MRRHASHHGGATRRETQLTAPFDLETAPVSDRGSFIGDAVGLAADGSDFVAAQSITTGDPNNRTNLVAVRAEAPQPSTRRPAGA